MGEAKNRSRNRKAILAGEPRCIYCGEPAQTIEHMPPSVMFREHWRPNGMEFAACSVCNHNTGAADLVASFLARLSPFEGEDGWRIKEAKGLKRKLDKKAPGVLEELFRDDKHQRKWIRGPGGLMVPSEVVTADGPLLNAHIRAFGTKMGMALYREHVGVALPLTGGVKATCFLNAGLAQTTATAIMKITPQFATLEQGKFKVPDQFAYRYNTDGQSGLLALVRFHAGLHVVTFATSMPEFYNFPVDPLFREPYVKPGWIRDSHAPAVS